MDEDFLALLINYILIGLLAISFICILLERFVSNNTLYDRTVLPSRDPQKLEYFIEPLPNGQKVLYPSIFDEPTVYVSFIVPAYNEALRIPKMLDSTIAYLKSRESESFTWEIIVVNDGSKDSTPDIVLSYASKNPNIRLLRQPCNMGKGAAVQAGCLHARGQLILMIDADGATEVSEFGALEKKILDMKRYCPQSVVVGSRARLDNVAKSHRTPIRNFLGWCFHQLIVFSGVKGIQDTQCGFKLFTREAARWLFPNQHVQRWCFDPELLLIARKKDMAIAEIPVEWNEIDGSLMRFSGMVKMGIDLMRIAIFYRIGLWRVEMKAPINNIV